jgi:RNA polymerase sigma-70 factor (ECF subfamily)
MSKTLQKASLFFLNSHVKPQALEITSAASKPKKIQPPNAIDKLFKAHWRDVCRILHKCYGSGPPEPEDVAQEAFSRVAQMRDLKHIEDPKAYIIKIAMNITLKSIGHLCKTRDFIAQHTQLPENQCDDVCPEIILQGEQRIAAIQKGTEQLTEKQRDILMRARIKGQTYLEISSDTGWSVADICRQLNAVMAILERIDEQENNPNGQAFSSHMSTSNISTEPKS